MSFQKTTIWKNALEEGYDANLLKNSFLASRDRAKALAEEIAKQNPGFTVHDISHIDALWDTASLVIGDAFTLSPIEAYVLGMSFLIHDLAMSNVSVENVEAIENSNGYRDLLAYQLKEIFRRPATPKEIANATSAQRQKAMCDYLRENHAKNAAKLPILEWENKGNKYSLIETPEIREGVGQLIGQIAESHWWDLDRVQSEFSDHIGRPSFVKSDSEFRPMLIAIVLRLADVIQVDDRRAPSFLYAIRKPDGLSNEHWNFQNLLNLPTHVHGRLRFRAKRPFTLEERHAWWLCFDTLQYADRELINANHVTQKIYSRNLGVQSIENVDSAERFSTLIPTVGWEPVDIQIRVSNVAKITSELGGKTLYGDNPYVGLRELVQNGCDAVRARRVYENRSERWGKVTVTLGEEDNREYLEVSDDGIGMSRNVLTGALLDFGASHWNSPQLAREYPGLLSKGFASSGRYGIGFFAIFMLGNEVQVTTRRCKDAPNKTRVLCFSDGLNDRPILRSAEEHELLFDPGTTIRVWLNRKTTEKDGLLSSLFTKKVSLKSLCEWLFPSLDVDLECVDKGDRNMVVRAGDWKTIKAEEIYMRVNGIHQGRFTKRSRSHLDFYDKAISTIKNEFGDVIGRGSIALEAYSRKLNEDYVVCSHGIRIGSERNYGNYGLFGIFEGEPTRMSRESSQLVASAAEITKWAENQVRFLESFPSQDDLPDAAENLARFGANISALKVIRSGKRWINFNEMLNECDVDDKILVIHGLREYDKVASKKKFKPRKGVFVVTERSWGFNVGMQTDSHFTEVDDLLGDEKRSATWKFLFVSLARKWNLSVETLFHSSEMGSEINQKNIGKFSEKQEELLLEADVLKRP